MSEFRFPKIVVREIVEEEGRKYTKALTSPVCDFCFDERATWDYQCEDFSVETSEGPWGSTNGWATCDQCSQLVEEKLWNDLVARILRSWYKLGTGITAEKIEDAGAIVFGFADHYTPGRVAFG